MVEIFMNNRRDALKKLRVRIVSCRRCPRLISYISEIAKTRVRRYANWSYWGKPLPGFGDPDARLLIIGLAPAAHGGNRTGRMFTGDSSGDWLVRALYETGFANKPTSVDRDDGLELASAYITASVRCAPPNNKPTVEEIKNCSEYLLEEIRLLEGLEVVLTLGRTAFNTYLKYAYAGIAEPKPHFQHGELYEMKGKPMLAASYHPSRQNTQTGKLTWKMWIRTFKRIEGVLHR